MLMRFAGGDLIRTPKSVVCLLLVMAAAFSGAAVQAETPRTPDGSFLRSEYLVLGREASGSWVGLGIRAPLAFDQTDTDGLGDEFGTGGGTTEAQQDTTKGPSNTGDKVKAGLFSLLIPGTGQIYNGQNSKGYIMLGVEVAIWATYFVFDNQGDQRMDSAQEWAGIYAGTRGDHENSYWQNVGHYMDSDAYNESVLREARALQETPSGLVYGSDAWQWVNEDRKNGYSQLRADGNSAYDKRDFMILFSVINRTISVVDAVLNAGKKNGVLETQVMGMNMELEMLPSFRDPGARWVVSRRF